MSTSDNTAQIRELAEQMAQAELRLRPASETNAPDTWTGVLTAYRQAVQALEAAVKGSESNQKDRKIAALDHRNRVLHQRCDRSCCPPDHERAARS